MEEREVMEAGENRMTLHLKEEAEEEAGELVEEAFYSFVINVI